MFAVFYLSATVITVILLAILGRQRRGLALLMGALAFGVVGFVMTPGTNYYVDTIRFFSTLNETRTYMVYSAADAWYYLMDTSGYDSVPVIGIILYLVAMQQQNGWLTFIAAAADVGAGFYLVYKQIGKNGSKAAVIRSVVVFLCIFNFNAGVSGIRNYLAGFWAVCIAYKYSKKLSVWGVILCVPLMLIHPFVGVIAVIYIASTSFNRHKCLYSIFCVVVLLQRFWQDWLFSFFERFKSIPFFGSLFFKSSQYFGDGAYLESSSNASRIRSILLLLFFMFIITVAVKAKYSIPNRYVGFAIMFICLCVGAWSDEGLFSRCVSMMTVIVVPFVCEIVRNQMFGMATVRKAQSIPSLIIFAGAFVIFIDNLRAGITFQRMVMSGYSLGLIITICILVLACIAAAPDGYKLDTHRVQETQVLK